MQTKKITTVIGGLRIALQSLSDKLGVTLAIGGSEACTNGSVITLPDLPAEDEKAALLARGYIDHETAHIRHTDFGIPVRSWLNLIEDVRIERAQGLAYPGCAANLRQLAAHLRDQGHFRGHTKDPLSLLMSWACCRGRSAVLGQPLGETADEMEKASRTMFGDLFCDAFARLVAEIGSCQSTADCDELARRIEDLIHNPPEPPPQPQPQADCKQGQESAPGQDEPPGESPEGRGEGEGSSPMPTSRQLQALKKAASADAEKASKELNVGEILKAALGVEHRQAAQACTLETIPDTHHHVGATSSGGDQKRVERELGLDQARRLTAQTRARLAGHFQAVRLQRSHPKQVGHRIDREAVHRIACATPDARYFCSRRLRQDENTAVVILGDRSGSMYGEKIKVAIQSTFVTAEALELLPGVTCSVGFFPWGPTQVAQLKDFGEKPKASRFAIGASGGTPMAEALLWAGMRLSQRKEPRKIIVFMTDGQADDCQKVKRTMERLSVCGIEAYGVGIQDRSILLWMPTGARVIQNCAELPLSLVGVLQDALLGLGKNRTATG